MNRPIKILVIALTLFCVTTVAVALAYQRHLRFLVADYSRVSPPAKQIAFPTPGIKPVEQALVLDGMRMPFSEADISGIQTHEKLSSVMVELKSGVEVILHAPRRQSSKLEYLEMQLISDISSRNDFRWSMTAAEVEQLHDRLMAKGSLLNVTHLGLRQEPTWYALLNVYSKLSQIEWITRDEEWGSCIQFIFRKSPLYDANELKQFEFMSQFECVATPTGRFNDEVESLIERIRAKDSEAVKVVK
jgi:hypothetical protein